MPAQAGCEGLVPAVMIWPRLVQLIPRSSLHTAPSILKHILNIDHFHLVRLTCRPHVLGQRSRSPLSESNSGPRHAQIQWVSLLYQDRVVILTMFLTHPVLSWTPHRAILRRCGRDPGGRRRPSPWPPAPAPPLTRADQTPSSGSWVLKIKK